MEFHRLAAAEIDWPALDVFEDRIFSQRRPWLEFIKSFVNGDIVVAELRDLGTTLGYFTGIRSRVYGIPVLGSPFRGWLTHDIGFNLAADVPRGDVLEALERFAFKRLGCLQLEVADRHLATDAGTGLGFQLRLRPSHLSDLTGSEATLCARLSSSTRWSIRQAERNGLRVEIAGPAGFADEYYRQFTELCARQGRRPPYPIERVRRLIELCHGSGGLLLARVRHPDGRSIATGIYLGFNKVSHFWGNGSLGADQRLRPNEALHWFAMRYWKQRGMAVHDWGGADAYKEKYGCTVRVTPLFRKSRYRLLERARTTVLTLRALPRRLRQRGYQPKIQEAS